MIVRTMSRKLKAALFILTLCAGPAFAGIRAAGSILASSYLTAGTPANVGGGNNDEFYFGIVEELPDAIEIRPNPKKAISLSFHLPKGKYDFPCGYGGGVHDEKGLASNIVVHS